ncbi:helix-turn-helix transcriptional regulator [Cupriavidus pinatubonensis]|uniref:Phage transcriptional regulator, AlpA n=1 Tax=Cupriavidus pinatubonensis TaxID=248026 RepID=A0ABM8WLK9_9BURK|nr:transcriptional regulator [Cupriavidus pinatubonensis]CAG9168107.1 hypothetical protein LMG23994_01308 [Cupriavidus pinatubonensis]
MAQKIEIAAIELTQKAVLPMTGVSRYGQIAPFISLSREKWRQLVLAGKAPQAIRMGTRCTVYKNSDVHAWLADPMGYRAEVLA